MYKQLVLHVQQVVHPIVHLPVQILVPTHVRILVLHRVKQDAVTVPQHVLVVQQLAQAIVRDALDVRNPVQQVVERAVKQNVPMVVVNLAQVPALMAVIRHVAQIARALVQNHAQEVVAVAVQDFAEEVVEQYVNQVVHPAAQVDVMESLDAESAQVYVQDVQTCVLKHVHLAVTVDVVVAAVAHAEVIVAVVVRDVHLVAVEVVQVVAIVDVQMAVKELVMVNV